jgi:hypothetical protein
MPPFSTSRMKLIVVKNINHACSMFAKKQALSDTNKLTWWSNTGAPESIHGQRLDLYLIYSM